MKAAQGGQRKSVNQAKEARSVGKIQFLTVVGANVSTLLVLGITCVVVYFIHLFDATWVQQYTSDENEAMANTRNLYFYNDISRILVCFDSICNDFCSHFLAVWVDDDSLAVAKRIQEDNMRAASADDDHQSPSVAP